QPEATFDADRLEELLRSSVAPTSWDKGASILRSSGGLFFIRQTAEGHREVQKLIRTLTR
nr:hypothetical protein [Planctomycetota bacterium]